MHNFKRALQGAIPFWPSLAVATLCSMMVAALWGGNILAFFPILQVTLRGVSYQEWIDEEIEKHRVQIQNLETQVADLKLKIDQAAGNEEQNLQLKRDLAKAEANFMVESQELHSKLATKPFVDRWLPRTPFKTVTAIVGVLMVSTVIKHLFTIANELLVGRVAIDIARSIRQRIFDKAMHLDRASFSQLGTSGFSAHITHTAEGLSTGLMNTLGAAIREPLKIFACLAGAGWICWRLLLISLIVAPAVGFVLVRITRHLKSLSHRMLSRASSFHEVMLESLGNIQTVQAYAMEEKESQRFHQATEDMRNFGIRFIFYTALTKPVIEFLGLGMLCTTILGGSYLVLNQKTDIFGIPICSHPLSVPDLLIFFGCLIGASDPLRRLSAIYSSIYAGAVAADALFPLLDRPSQIQDPEYPVSAPSPHQKIELQNITFGYRADAIVLRDVSIDIPFGSTVAIVGHNGSGKSTLISLLCRFYDPLQGQVSIDGVDLRDMRLKDVRNRVALVTQHTELFNDTIRANIAYGSENPDDASIFHASQEAHAHEFISNLLPDQYETKVGYGGHRLSGGQRQRIALARALLRNPEILILDEATSQIDMKSEELIRESLMAHRGKRTIVIITHREALLEMADLIYEVRDGGLHPTTAVHYRAA
ncbi:MAG: ABC transporter ATP-binding protein [Pirellulales bacterium]